MISLILTLNQYWTKQGDGNLLIKKIFKNMRQKTMPTVAAVIRDNIFVKQV